MLQHVDKLPQSDPEQALAGDDPDLQQEFLVNRAHIYRGHSLDSNPAIYNFPTEDLKGGLDEIDDRRIYSIFQSETQALRLNLALGYMLRHITTGAYHYYIPYRNNTVFDTHISISAISDQDRSGSWKIVCLTNNGMPPLIY